MAEVATQYDFGIGDTVKSTDGYEGKVTYVPGDYGPGSFVMVSANPREGRGFWPQELTILHRAKQRAPKTDKSAEKTPGQVYWEKQRKTNPSLHPWKKLGEEVRARAERYAIHGCECGYCSKEPIVCSPVKKTKTHPLAAAFW